jgi:hypothetical protein
MAAQDDRSGEADKARSTHPEDVFSGTVELTARQRGYVIRALEDLYMNGCPGFHFEGGPRKWHRALVRALLDPLKLTKMVSPDGAELVSPEDHRERFAMTVQDRSGKPREAKATRLEDVFSGVVDLTARQRSYVIRALEELYMNGCPGFHFEGDPGTWHRALVHALLDSLKLTKMVLPGGTEPVSPEEHHERFEVAGGRESRPSDPRDVIMTKPNKPSEFAPSEATSRLRENRDKLYAAVDAWLSREFARLRDHEIEEASLTLTIGNPSSVAPDGSIEVILRASSTSRELPRIAQISAPNEASP